MFDLIRNLIDVRFTGTHAIHAIVHKQNRRIYALTNFNISPVTLIEKSDEDFNNTYEAVYNLQKVLNVNESLRPKIRARQTVPLNFIYQNDFIFEDMSVIAPELVNVQQLISEKVAAYDFLTRQINHMRREHNNVSVFVQQKIYAAKAAEASLIMRQKRRIEKGNRKKPLDLESFAMVSPYLKDYADSKGIDIVEAAEKVYMKAEKEKKDLLHSESERIRMNNEISESETVEQLHESVKAFIERNKDKLKL